MVNSESAIPVLSNYYRQQFPFATPTREFVEFIGNASGFSGASLWIVRDQDRFLCLRCWPDSKSVSASNLLWIHAQLTTSHRNGCSFVPVPLPSDQGTTVVQHESRFWQLEPWMPGVPDYYQAPSVTKLKAAMQALAQVHESLGPAAGHSDELAVSSGLMFRHQEIGKWFDGKNLTDHFQQLRWCVANKTVEAQLAESQFPWTELGTQLTSHFGLVAGHVRTSLAVEIQSPVRIQPIIGDIWHDHVLFTGDEVTGIVDFGSMRMDTVACDVARLLGSLVDDYTKTWFQAISIYGDATTDKRIGVCQEFHNLVRAFDVSSTALSGLNWLSWLFVEERRFEDYRTISNRLQRIAFRLEKLLRSL